MKKAICLFFSFCLFFSMNACSSTSSTTTVANTPAPVVEPTPEPLEAYVQYLRESLVDAKGTLFYSVKESMGVITVDCYGDTVDTIFTAVLNDYLTYSKDWDTVRTVTNNMSAAIKKESEGRGLDISVVASMVNSADTSVIYYSSQDGKKLFDSMDILPESQITLHGPSMYKVGTDLAAGEYYILPVDKKDGVYMCVSSDGNGDNILENSFQDGPHYITVQDGQYLKVTNGHFALASEFPARPKEVVSGEGMYLVGKDIVAGEYKLTCDTGAKGYWCIYSVSTADRSIVNNSIFENAAYVTVSDGQYLLVSSCSGILVK